MLIITFPKTKNFNYVIKHINNNVTEIIKNSLQVIL